MRIAVVRPQVPFERGGAEIMADRLVEELVDHGHEAELVTVPFKWYPGTRVLTQAFLWRLLVEPKFSEPPASERARIAAEARRLGALFSASAAERYWRPPFQAPVGARASSPFGVRSVFNGQPRSRHNGVDFASPAGDPVHEPGAGRVVLAEPLYFTGNTVIIDHGQGLYSLLAHLERMVVKSDDVVARNDIVGYVGATGRATGPHLHWTVRLQGARVDPLLLVSRTRALSQ